MRLQKYIKEEIDNGIKKHWNLLNKKLSKKYNIKDNDIKKAKKEISKKYKIKEEYLNFVFIWELAENMVKLTYNVEDEKSKLFQSSLSYTWLPIEKRGI